MTEISTFALANNQYNEVIILDEYNGVYSLIQGKAGNDRNFWKMAYPQTKDKQPTAKAIPMKVTLGDRQEAAKALRYLADSLDGGQDSEPESTPDHSQFGNSETDESNVPF